MSSICFISSVLLTQSVSLGGGVWPLGGPFVSMEISILASMPVSFFVVAIVVGPPAIGGAGLVAVPPTASGAGVAAILPAAG